MGNKNRRSTKKNKKGRSKQPKETCQCRHGCPEEVSAEHLEFVQEIGASGITFPLIDQVPNLMDKDALIQTCISMATDIILKNYDDNEDHAWGVAKRLLEAAAVVKALNLKGEEWCSQQKVIELVRKVATNMAMRMYSFNNSRKETADYLDRKIPCNCLDDLKQKLLTHPDTFKCATCNKKNENLKVCPLCKVAHYCSRECQLAGWSDHKAQCKNNQGKSVDIENLEEMKQEVRQLGRI